MTSPVERLTTALADRYRVLRELGAGGMATVYLAHDLKHERDVAIKVLHPDLGAALGGERFLSEIRTTARLQHPHILPLLDSGEADGLLYYVMPLVTGETLRARLERERQLPINDAVRIAREVASALDYAHRQNVIHRDIKPENILLHDGSALVADFGIALAVQSAGGQRMTQTGLSLGTPQYMSPEQAMGERTIDARSDIYALGAVTYEMLAGEPPFSGPSVQAIVAKVLSERPTALHTVRDTVPAPVEHAVMSALAKLPADRFATAAEFATALSATSAAPLMAAPVAGMATRPLARDPRTWITLAAVTASLAIAAWSFRQPSVVASAEVRQQATYSGRATNPAISADGRFLAYLEQRCPAAAAVGGCVHLMVVEVGGTRPVEVVTGAERLSVPRWTHDGLSIVFGGAIAAGRAGLFVVPRLGGIPRRLADEPVVYETHPTADSVAMIVARNAKTMLEVMPLASGTATRVPLAVSVSPVDLAWSPDAERFALNSIDTLRLVGRDGHVLSARSWQRMRPPVRWSASGRSILGFEWTAGVNDNLVAFSIDDDHRIGTRQLLVSQLPTTYKGAFDVARKTGRLVVASGLELSDLWSIDLSSDTPRTERLTQGTNWHGSPTLTADGRAVYYLRADQLGNSLYRIADGVDVAITAETQVVNNGLRLSPDERTITFESSVDSTPVLMVHDVAAGTTRQVRRKEFDMAWYLSGSNRLLWWSLQSPGLWTTDAEGNDRRDIVARPSGSPSTRQAGDWGLSPSGDAIVTASGTREATVFEILPLAGGAAKELARIPVSEGQAGVVTWARDGMIYLARRIGDERRTTVIGFDARSGARRTSVELPVACDPYSVSYAPAARLATCLVMDQRLDLTLIDGIRP